VETTSLSPVRVWICCGIAALSSTGCRDASGVPNSLPPLITGVTAQANPFNTLSTVVTFQAQLADSARLMCSPEGGGPASQTPYSAVAAGTGRITALDLLPQTPYECRVAALGAGGTSMSESVTYQVAELPVELAGVHLDITGSPLAGYVLTEVTHGSDAFAVAFDSAGNVRWYRAFAAASGEAAADVDQQPNGDFTLYVGASTGWQPTAGRYYEFRPDGELIRTYAASAPYYTDPHELVLTTNSTTASSALWFAYDLRTVDLTMLGGRADQRVAGHSLLRQSDSGASVVLWDAWDHLSLADWVFVPANLSSYPSIDFDHPNSLAIDRDGNYVVSFAMPGEIAKIDAASGQFIWQLGGRHNQFTIVGDPLGGFGFQHDVRILDNGDLLFYDNGLLHSPPQSRAVQYRLDPPRMTATLVWEYRHSPPVFTPFVGTVQRLADGSTLVGFAAADLMNVVTGSGQLVWEGRLTIDGQPVPYFYRARRIASLYEYARP
jgi:hypothetical protein